MKLPSCRTHRAESRRPRLRDAAEFTSRKPVWIRSSPLSHEEARQRLRRASAREAPLWRQLEVRWPEFTLPALVSPNSAPTSRSRDVLQHPALPPRNWRAKSGPGTRSAVEKARPDALARNCSSRRSSLIIPTETFPQENALKDTPSRSPAFFGVISQPFERTCMWRVSRPGLKKSITAAFADWERATPRLMCPRRR